MSLRERDITENITDNILNVVPGLCFIVELNMWWRESQLITCHCLPAILTYENPPKNKTKQLKCNSAKKSRICAIPIKFVCLLLDWYVGLFSFHFPI